MSSGSSQRLVDTPDAAVAAYNEIRRAGGTIMVIIDDAGLVCTLEQLLAAISTNQSPRPQTQRKT